MLRLKSLFVLLLLFYLPFNLQAHPSWGIVVDENGCIYFVDVMHNGDGSLWKLDPNTKKLEVVYSNFHAHQIYINKPNEIVAAIAKWRTGEIEGEGHNYLFKYTTNTKQLDTLLFTDDWDEFHGQNFAISNSLKEVYFSMNKKVNVKYINGNTKPLINHEFQRTNTLTTDQNGNLYITDSNYKNGTLYIWNKLSGLKELANNLLEQNPENPIFKEKRHQLFYGIAFSKDNNPLVTESASRTIKEVYQDGSHKIVYTSIQNWTPNGVFFKNGKYYIMETGYDRQHLGPRIIITDHNFKILQTFEIDFLSKRIK